MLMVKNFGLEAEGGGEKFLCGGTWRWRKFLSSLEGDMEREKNFFELLRGGIWRGRKSF